MNLRKSIDSVEVSNMCYETYPCQHDVTIKYKDGTQDKSCMPSPDIEKQYGKYLPNGSTHGIFSGSSKKTNSVTIEITDPFYFKHS